MVRVCELKRNLFDFWNESLWLPPNVKWGDIKNSPDKDIVYASCCDFWVLIPLVFLILLQRYLFKKYIFKPLALYLIIKRNKRRNASYPALEEYLKKSRKSTNTHTITNQLVMLERQILRQSQDKPSKIVKFCESMWKGFFCLMNTIFGLYTLWDKEWMWEIDECFIWYPYQGITADIWWYYMISSAFYWSLTISQFWDVRRKDFWQMFMHHIATILFLTISWIANLHRFGSLFLMIHDSSHIFLEFGKVSKCAGFKRAINVNFVIFLCLWWTMGMYFFPAYVLSALFIHLFKTPVVIFLISLINFIMVLNVIGSWMIVKTAVKVMITGEIKDNRSSNSED